MYEENDDFITPPEETRLWRYLDVGKFLNLLVTRELYFAKTAELDDPWEAAHPEILRKFVQENHVDLHGVPQLAVMYKWIENNAAVSCWHENAGESIAMWSLYNSGDEGVAIQTTCARLKAALSGESRKIFIGRVNYIDYDLDPMKHTFNGFSPLMHKRRSFQHEAEVRVLIPFLQDPNAVPVRISATEARIPDPPDRGVAVPIDLSVLIERLVLSPNFPTWALPAIQRLIAGFSLRLIVESSDLLKKPPGYIT